MPQVSKTLQQQIALPDEYFTIPDCFVPMVPVGHKCGTPAPLFQKLEASLGEEMRKKFAGTRPTTVSCFILMSTLSIPTPLLKSGESIQIEGYSGQKSNPSFGIFA